MFFNRVRWGLLAVTLVVSTSFAADPPAGLVLVPIEKGFENPLYFVHDPSGRNFVVEQPGRVDLLKDGKKQKPPYLDIKSRVRSDGECGLLSIAFHPQFEQNGRLFVDYSSPTPHLHTVIAEYHADPKAETVDPSTEKILLTIDKPQPNHNGGLLIFGPDGMLYTGTGDGGGGGDGGPGHAEKTGNGQSHQTLLGKMLRLDVDHGSPYGIPKDNPFVDKPDYRPEIWAIGMRNPWRWSFDRETGELYCGDVGQNTYEEVDIIVKGGNYGWRIREGLHRFGNVETSPDKLIDPIAEYDHKTGGQCITGGFVYRGKKYPDLVGIYLYADYAKGRIWGLRYEQGKVTWQGEFAVTVGARTGQNLISLDSFGEDIDGELYCCDHDRGTVYHIEPNTDASIAKNQPAPDAPGTKKKAD